MLKILCFLCSSCEECRSRKRCPHVCVFRGIGEKHPRDWLLLFADPISYTFGRLKLRFRTGSKIPCSSNLWLLNKHIWAQIKALRVVGRWTIICYSSLVLIKLFVTRFHCICPDYHHIAPESTKLGRLRKTQRNFGQQESAVLKIPTPISASKRNQREPEKWQIQFRDISHKGFSLSNLKMESRVVVRKNTAVFREAFL